VRLMLWDTAGQEEFDAITKAYYRGAQACVIAFSTVDRVSDNLTIYFSMFSQAFVSNKYIKYRLKLVLRM
jgi:hypothetical protein